MEAAWAIGQFGDKRALPHLLDLLHDDHEEVREIAAEYGLLDFLAE
jgi:HEAT repeat protein